VDSQPPVTVTPQYQQFTTVTASLSVATAMASVAMTVGFIYRSTDAAATLPRQQKQQRCSVAPDGIVTAWLH